MIHRSHGLRIALLVTASLAACHGDGARPSSNGPRPGSDGPPMTDVQPASPGGAAADGRRCLPAMVCDRWIGCALVASAADRWSVVAADELAAGLPVTVANGCTNGDRCDAAKAMPPGTVCAPDSTPPLVLPPPYACVGDATVCRRLAR